MRKTKVKRLLSFAAMTALLLVTVVIVPPTAFAASDVTVNWTDVKQNIDGFGVSQAGWSDAIYDLQEPARSQVMDLLFRQDTGIGASILRGAIFPDFNPAPGVYDFGARPDQIWVMQQAEARGVDKMIATCWSPPAWMKTNDSTTNGGYLEADCYDDYALLLSKFIKEYDQQYGIDLYGISICNEPNSGTFLSWDSCEWNSTNIEVFLKDYLKQEMINQGVSDTSVIIGEPSWWSEDLMKDALNDTASCERVDIVAGHNYPVPVVNLELPTTPFSTAVSKGKQVWMTEVSQVDSYDPGMTSGLKFAKQIHNFMTKANVNAWMYWTGAIPGDNDEGLINVDKAASTYELTKRFYTFGSYSKFIRPGYVRIGATESPASGVYISAYKDPATGKFVVVAINDSTSTCETNIVPSGFTSGVLTPYTTNDELDMQQGRNISLVSGKFKVIIPPKSVVTYTGQKDSAAVPAEQLLTDNLNNWDYTASHTAGLAFDSTNAFYFDWDYSRVKRTIGTTQSFVYNLQNITYFKATLYQFSIWDGVAFYASSDNLNWTKLAHVSTNGVYTGSEWYRKIYYPLTLMPVGTNYLKVELSGSDTWEKQVSKMEINYKP